MFADIDRGNTQRLEIFLPAHLFSRGDVLCLDVVCVPNDVTMCAGDLVDVCEGVCAFEGGRLYHGKAEKLSPLSVVIPLRLTPRKVIVGGEGAS